MKKVLSLALVLIFTMSLALTASAADGITLPSIEEAFNAVTDFMKLEPIMAYADMFHAAMANFYTQLDVILQVVGEFVYVYLGGVFA